MRHAVIERMKHSCAGPHAASSTLLADTVFPGTFAAPANTVCIARPNGRPLAVVQEDAHLVVQDLKSNVQGRWRMAEEKDGMQLAWRGPCSGEPTGDELLAVIEAAFTLAPAQARLSLVSPLPPKTVGKNLTLPAADGNLVVLRNMFYQNDLWLTSTAQAIYPLHYTLTQGRRHPARPQKPDGVVYQRYIPWLKQTLSFRVVDPECDLPTFHRWMNDPIVDLFWQERGDLARHRTYLDNIAADPHTLPLFAALDGQDFAYFEVYWAKEDRIAPFCDAGDHDRGWHVLVGEPAFRGKAFLTAWLPSISHYIFLDDARTQRIVIEPRIDNDKLIRSLARCGYALVKEFDFPHKRAMLGTLSRERFFNEAIWIPKTASPSVTSGTSKEDHAHS